MYDYNYEVNPASGLMIAMLKQEQCNVKGLARAGISASCLNSAFGQSENHVSDPVGLAIKLLCLF